MIPVDQEFLHKPEEGQYGDCWRACIASILDLPREQVPHFLHDDCNATVFHERVDAFLDSKGLEALEVYESDAWNAFQYLLTPDTYHLISDRSPRFAGYHGVVGKMGLIVHDPHPTRAGLLQTDQRTFTFIVKKEVK